MRFKFAGNKKDIAAIVFRNNEATLAIKLGAPVVQDFADTDNLGVDGKTCVSLAAAQQGGYWGTNITGDVESGNYGEAQVYGHNNITRVQLTSRAASTDVWASIAAGTIGEYLTMVTGTGNTASNGDQCLVRVATAAQTVNQFARLAETWASTDTQASSVGPQSMTIWTTTRNVFLRAM